MAGGGGGVAGGRGSCASQDSLGGDQREIFETGMGSRKELMYQQFAITCSMFVVCGISMSCKGKSSVSHASQWNY